MHKYLLAILLIAACASRAAAQQTDTASVDTKKLEQKKNDTTVNLKYRPEHKKAEIYHPDSLHSPHLAVMRSLLIPGWGQIYNRSYWKVPVIYGALGVLVYYIIWNNTNYQEFLQLSLYREHGVTPVPGDKYYAESQEFSRVTSQALYDANDYYHRNRDLCILGVLGVWGVNAVEAYITAKFIHSYSVDNNLSMRVQPALLGQPLYALNANASFIPAIKITFALR